MTRRINSLGGDEWFFGRIIDGDSMSMIAETLGVSRNFLYSWINLKKGERRAALVEARRLSANAHVEDGQDILAVLADKPELTSAEVSLAASRPSTDSGGPRG